MNHLGIVSLIFSAHLAGSKVKISLFHSCKTNITVKGTTLDSLAFLPRRCKIWISWEAFPGNIDERRFATMLFAPKERGQGLVEYALILVLVAIVVIAALMVLGPIIGNVFTEINSSLVNRP